MTENTMSNGKCIYFFEASLESPFQFPVEQSTNAAYNFKT